jgi:hypothetical protein
MPNANRSPVPEHTMTRIRRYLLLAALAGMAAPLAAEAQARPISLWLGAGRQVVRDSSLSLWRELDAYGAVQLDVPLMPIALRADASIGGGDARNGTRNVSASAVLPLRLPIVQPYAMLGYGIYDWGRPLEQRGVSYGAGVRVQLGGLGVFGQLRHHRPLDRSVGTIGVVF